MYRVRKNWNEPKTQLGAYNILDYAIECCNKAGSEYFVFDEDGSVVYPKEDIVVETNKIIKTGKELAEACINTANNYKTLYVTGCFGWPMTEANKTRIKNEWAANRKPPRSTNIDNASVDTFGFDCVNLVKALLWGWNGDVNAEYGGAKYQSNGVPDVDESTMFNSCLEKSSDFDNIEIGEMCWMKGHCGIYVGNGLTVECTPAWTNNVQFTACNKNKDGYNLRVWTEHGKLPYISYTGQNDSYMKSTVVKPAQTKDSYYRVRKSWQDASSQIGAYSILENAINACKLSGAEYRVYDPDGIQMYPELQKEPYMVRVKANQLNMRKGPSTNYPVVCVLKKNEAYTIVDEQQGWGLLKSYAKQRDGWICLSYTEKV